MRSPTPSPRRHRWGAFVAATLVLWLGPEAGAREFRATDTQSEDYPTVQALVFMDRVISERTGGRHRIRVFHSRQLGEERDTIEQTRIGAIDLNRTNVAPLGGFIPTVNALALPFQFHSTEHLHRVLDGAIGEEILASFAPYGFVGLTYYDSGARSIYNSVRPVRQPQDMKGLRIRVQQSEQMVEMIRALGAEPVELPYGQVLTGLTTRLIDGAENNWPSYVTTDHYKVARHYALTEHTMGPEVLIMSVKAWQELSPEDQALFKDAARQSSQFMRTQWMAWEARARDQAEQAGNLIVPSIDKGPFAAAMSGLHAKAAQDPRMRGLVERMRQLQ